MIQLTRKRANSSQAIVLIIIVLFLLQACVVPGLTPQPVPTTDPNTLFLIVAGTAAAANTQTAVAAPPTPTLPETSTPTETPTSTPLTATPESVFSAEGTALIPDENGSTLFVDQTLGYRLRVPAGWLLVRINEREMTDAFNLPAASDPRVKNFLIQVQKNDPKTFRLFGADTDSRHMETGFVTNFNVFWDAGSTGSLDDMISMLEDQLPRTSLSPVVTHSEVSFTSSRIPFGTVESTATLFSTMGWPVNLFQKQILFRLPAGVLTVVLSTTDEQKNGHLPDFDAMVDQIVLLEP